MSGFRQKCIGTSAVVGSFASIPHPAAVEISAAAGFDFLCIDWEHSQFSRGDLENLVRAADVHGLPAIVRVPGHGQEAIAAALDSGAQGVLVPRVSTAEQACSAVMATRYPPVGQRGVGPGRAAGYGYRIPEYLSAANNAILLAVQVETADGLANVDAIASTEGIDVIFVGPGDLSVSIGAMGPSGAAKLNKAIETILATAQERDKVAGIFCGRPEDVGKWSGKGASFFILASDGMFLGAASKAAATDARALLPQTPKPARKTTRR
ncbi:MAG TPA: aldolase/citrate lyase family protein [Rhizobiaceae bacterium]|nr:aldolase/citrate lyase family protein [Rhizobiaceae bacterium]